MNDVRLAVRSLTVAYRRRSQPDAEVVHNFDLDLVAGRVTGLAGESGCGKSTAALVAIGYRAGGAVVVRGSAMLGDRDLLREPVSQLRRVWGSRIGYVPQAASSSLNPSIRIGRQLRESLQGHDGYTSTLGAALLERVGIPRPQEALRRYPFEFSGGQQQRIAIALALAPKPDVLILDEPATGLDVTTQARINRLLGELLAESGAAALYVSHDLALLSAIADDLVVMYAGEVVERARPARALFDEPRHPYTRALLECVPDVSTGRRVVGIPGLPPPTTSAHACAFSARCALVIDRCRDEHPELEESGGHAVRCFRWRIDRAASSYLVPLATPVAGGGRVLAVDSLSYHYPGTAEAALQDVSLDLAPGQTLGVVGESGSGKTTLLRLIAGMVKPTAGTVLFRGVPLGPLRARSRQVLSQIQIIFQNPASSLNPRQTVRDEILRPLEVFRPELDRGARAETVTQLLDSVRLPAGVADRYPAELSGGQQQRVAIARAFAADPAVLLCDEITSALDVSVQASVLELLHDLTTDSHTAVVFVSHDLGVIRTIAPTALVMKDGTVCERGSTNSLFESPEHAYTQELIGSTVGLDRTPIPTTNDPKGRL